MKLCMIYFNLSFRFSLLVSTVNLPLSNVDKDVWNIFFPERPQLVTLLKNIPDIAAKAIENSDRVPALRDVIGEYLLPLVVRNITGSCRGIDAATYTVLELIKRGFVSKFEAEIKICPSILALTKKENDWNVLPGIISVSKPLEIRFLTVIRRIRHSITLLQHHDCYPLKDMGSEMFPI